MFRRILAATGVLALGAGLTLVATAPAVADETITSCDATTEYRWQAPDDDLAEGPEFWPSADGFAAGPPPADLDWGEPVASQSAPARWQSDDPAGECYVAPDPVTVPDEVVDPVDETDETEPPAGPESSELALPTFSALSTTPTPTVQQCASPNPATYVRSLGGMYFEDRTGGSHALTASGLEIAWGGADLTQAKSAGYVPVVIPFEQLGTPALDYAVASGASAGLNLVLFKDGAWFGTLVLEPLFPQYWINKAVPGMPAGPNSGYQLAYGTLDEFLAAFDAASWDVDVVAVGYSGGSGSVGAGTVTSLTAGCDTWVFQAATNEVCSAFTSIVVSSLADLDLSQSRSDGHQELLASSLHVWTGTATGSPDPRKAAGYLDVPDFPLTQTGTVALDWSGTSPPPGGQIVVDLDGNGSPDGILVFEPAFYGQNLWLASIAAGFDTTGAPAVGGGGGSINGSIDQYLAVWPDAKGLALGYSLGSGVTGDGELSLLQAGCLQITFELDLSTLPLPTDPEPTPVGEGELDTLAVTGADANPGLTAGSLLLVAGLALLAAAAGLRRRGAEG